MFVRVSKVLFRMFLVLAGVLAFGATSHAGFLYVLNERNGAANQIYGFSVNESTGALTPLSGFPLATGGNGSNTTFTEMMVVDRANLRLYAINLGSNTLSAFSINPATGALVALPFSPLALGLSGSWRTVNVHASGSPVIVGDGGGIARVLSINVTATTATPAAGSPFSTGTAFSFSSVFSRDNNFLYSGGSLTATTFAGFGVNPASGVLTVLPGSAFNSGSANPASYAIDSRGRLFMANATQNQLRVFPTTFGIPIAATGNPFTAGLTTMLRGLLHPNERFYFVSDLSGNRVGGYEIVGSGTATTLTAVAGSPVTSGGSGMTSTALNNAGTFLFATHDTSRNVATYSVNPTTGALTFGNLQAANTVGPDGGSNGMAYLPTVFTVTNANDTGVGSLRQVVLEANAAGGGIISFDRTFFGVPRTITLTTGQITLSSNIHINGTGAANLTIRVAGTPSSINRAFNVSTGGMVTLTGMTLTGGNVLNPGGAIFTTGLLTVSDCVITGNTASSVGGGINNQGSVALLNVINSTIHNNTSSGSSSGGGGIYNSGDLTLTNSTISGNRSNNSTTNGGGGIYSQGNLTLTNSTITGNAAAGNNSSSGVFAGGGTVTVRNSIIAGNVNNATTPDVALSSGAFTSNGFNLVGNVGTVASFNQTGDQTGTGASPLDPQLVKVLAFRGGTTPTHALLPTSPAVDNGDDSNIVTDQRIVTRPFDNPDIPNRSDGADIGAFERGALESIHSAPFDFDGDNKTDIAIFRPAPREWWINLSSTSVTTAGQFGGSADRITPADFTGDGKADIAVWRPSTGEWFVLRSEDFSYFAFPFGTNGDVPVPADFDADGKSDATVFRPSSSTWFIRRSLDGGATIQRFGSPGDVPVPGDYDGDGKADIAIYRPSLGQWWVSRSTAGIIVLTFGASSDKPVQGDFTGDGKTDVAFWRPSTGEWFILRSEDFSFYSFPFGLGTDIPAPGDYDGDGQFDATVFRPSNSTWFSQRSTGGTLIQQFGAIGDRPVPNAFVP